MQCGGAGKTFTVWTVWYSNPDLRNWLKEHADTSPLAKLKWKYYMINKSPWMRLLRCLLMLVPLETWRMRSFEASSMECHRGSERNHSPSPRHLRYSPDALYHAYWNSGNLTADPSATRPRST